MRLSLLCCGLAVLSTAHTLPHDPRSGFVIKERHPVPPGWTHTGSPEKSDIIELQIGLEQRVGRAVEQHLEEISDPTHPRYGQHLNTSKIRDLVAPSDETRDNVRNWLREHGIADDEHRFSAARDWVTVAVSIETAEAMLDTSYAEFTHDDGTRLLRAPKWSLPAYLHGQIDVVQPTTSFLHGKPEVVVTGRRLSAAEFAEQVDQESSAVAVCHDLNLSSYRC